MWARVLLTAWFALAGAAWAHGRVITTPLMTAPCFAIHGESLAVGVEFDNEALVREFLIMRFDDRETVYALDSGERTVSGAEAFEFPVPADADEGLYDLCVEYSINGKSRTECQLRAVIVIREYKERFTFAVFADYHVGDNRGAGFNPGIPLKELRRKSVEALNQANPDFVLAPGDLTDYTHTYFMDYPEMRQELSQWVRVPMFAVPGNHDLYSQIDRMPQGREIDGLEFWKKTLGPTRMAFTYGGFRFIGFNSYSWPPEMRDRNREDLLGMANSGSIGIMSQDELEWLDARIKEARKLGLEPVLFAHHGPNQMSGFEAADEYGLINGEQFLEYLKAAGVRHYFHGHTHANFEEREGLLNLVSTSTVSSSIRREPGWSFRLVEVRPDRSMHSELVYFWKPVE